jgi:hypothetical protein
VPEGVVEERSLYQQVDQVVRGDITTGEPLIDDQTSLVGVVEQLLEHRLNTPLREL